MTTVSSSSACLSGVTKIPLITCHSNLDSVLDVPSSDLKHFPFCNNGYYVDIIIHCTGLYYVKDMFGMRIFNPAFREVRLIPPWPWRLGHFKESMYAQILRGFGRDHDIKDYKDVILVESKFHVTKIHSLFRAYAYNLSTRERCHVSSFTRSRLLCYLMDECIGADLIEQQGKKVEFSSQMSGEVVQNIRLPDAAVVDVIIPPYLDVLKESLALISAWRRNGEDYTDIWVMKEYDVKGILRIRLNLDCRET